MIHITEPLLYILFCYAPNQYKADNRVGLYPNLVLVC
jgi:hypothetical protein